MTQAAESTPRRRRRMKRKAALLAAGIMSIGGAAGASVLVQNFMQADFTGGAPPCLDKVAGADVAFDGFAFDPNATSAPDTVDGVTVTEERVTITGLTGDRVLAQDVFRIENNCAVPLSVSITEDDQTGDWTEKHLEVWLGAVAAPGDYPGVVATDYALNPLVFETGSTASTTDAVTIPAGESRPVGMIVTTGVSAAATPGTANWTVQATTDIP